MDVSIYKGPPSLLPTSLKRNHLLVSHQEASQVIFKKYCNLTYQTQGATQVKTNQSKRQENSPSSTATANMKFRVRPILHFTSALSRLSLLLTPKSLSFHTPPYLTLPHSHTLTNTTQLLTSLLALLFTLFTFTTALPTTSPTTDNSSTKPATDTISQAQATLVCHSGLPASVCAAGYSASCSDNGGFYSHPAENGRSCTSRQCYCIR